jgi:hypothetical protein
MNSSITPTIIIIGRELNIQLNSKEFDKIAISFCDISSSHIEDASSNKNEVETIDLSPDIELDELKIRKNKKRKFCEDEIDVFGISFSELTLNDKNNDEELQSADNVEELQSVDRNNVKELQSVDNVEELQNVNNDEELQSVDKNNVKELQIVDNDEELQSVNNDEIMKTQKKRKRKRLGTMEVVENNDENDIQDEEIKLNLKRKEKDQSILQKKDQNVWKYLMNVMGINQKLFDAFTPLVDMRR